ncbi:hypothetical protein Lal_00043857 [Lupinus albus]|uniref:Uncharacterized protein n=1 Tax=Lupinus albus TaxID=3870 RepID=A0A6A4PE39_LUPAL|nr:hypothetical protein Lalb_Chr15g0090121 [Lupinus albus]KAF1895212.1 hypothetical protein Lal_00043857 [Lupinus albus]
MISLQLQPSYKTCLQSTLMFNPSKLGSCKQTSFIATRKVTYRTQLKCNIGEQGGENKAERRTFLTMEEAGLVEISGLSTHERFLCRLTISSLNLLRVISEQEGCSMEELNAGKICDWFLKDKLKREQNFDSAVLQWDDEF